MPVVKREGHVPQTGYEGVSSSSSSTATPATMTPVPAPPAPPPPPPPPAAPPPDAEVYNLELWSIPELRRPPRPQVLPTPGHALPRNPRGRRFGGHFERSTAAISKPGYEFLPKGNSFLTRRVKALSEAEEKIWYNVRRVPALTNEERRTGRRVNPCPRTRKIGLLVRDTVLAAARRLELEMGTSKLAERARQREARKRKMAEMDAKNSGGRRKRGRSGDWDDSETSDSSDSDDDEDNGVEWDGDGPVRRSKRLAKLTNGGSNGEQLASLGDDWSEDEVDISHRKSVPPRANKNHMAARTTVGTMQRPAASSNTNKTAPPSKPPITKTKVTAAAVNAIQRPPNRVEKIADLPFNTPLNKILPNFNDMKWEAEFREWYMGPRMWDNPPEMYHRALIEYLAAIRLHRTMRKSNRPMVEIEKMWVGWGGDVQRIRALRADSRLTLSMSVRNGLPISSSKDYYQLSFIEEVKMYALDFGLVKPEAGEVTVGNGSGVDVGKGKSATPTMAVNTTSTQGSHTPSVPPSTAPSSTPVEKTPVPVSTVNEAAQNSPLPTQTASPAPASVESVEPRSLPPLIPPADTSAAAAAATAATATAATAIQKRPRDGADTPQSEDEPLMEKRLRMDGSTTQSPAGKTGIQGQMEMKQSQTPTRNMQTPVPPTTGLGRSPSAPIVVDLISDDEDVVLVVV